MTDPQGRVRVLRVIARMNVGGPAYHVSLLSGGLNGSRFETLLVSGRVGPGEASFEELAERYGARLVRLPHLGPELRPLDDLKALMRLVRLMRRFRPQVVHTHTAKAGTLGRLAAVLALRPRPVVIHTFHGHVLKGYFGPRTTAVYRAIERALARVSDRLIGVSQAVVDDLVELGVASRERFTVVPLGLPLERFLAVASEPGAGPVREELGIGPDAVLALFVGRLAPIKRVDVLLEAFSLASTAHPELVLAIAGDGELRAELEQRCGDLGLARCVRFLGFRSDLDALLEAADLAVLSSDNEGTPVALIEAAAAARPAVATNVGGVSDIVRPETGILVEAGDAEAFADALRRLAADAHWRRELGTAARLHVAERYTADRLIADVERLYDELLTGSRRG